MSCIMLTAECSTVRVTKRMTGFSAFNVRYGTVRYATKISGSVFCIHYVIESCLTLSEIDVLFTHFYIYKMFSLKIQRRGHVRYTNCSKCAS
jgi:hypothetical protein